MSILTWRLLEIQSRRFFPKNYCVQVADRFHLLQNLIDRLKDIFKEEILPDIFIKDGAILDKVPDKIWKGKTIDAAVLNQYSYDDTPSLEPDETETEFVSTKRSLDLPHYKKAEENRKKTAISLGHAKTMAASKKQEICHNCRRKGMWG